LGLIKKLRASVRSFFVLADDGSHWVAHVLSWHGHDSAITIKLPQIFMAPGKNYRHQTTVAEALSRVFGQALNGSRHLRQRCAFKSMK
jgi:hypothetical protein